MPERIHHALVLNLHQPSGNLDERLASHPWDVRQILCAYDRIPRSLWGYEDLGRVHVSMSGTLLETLASPGFQERVYGIVKLGDLLWQYQNRAIIEVLGTGYYHPVLPLIPEADRDEHLRRWTSLARHLFWRQDFQGFWPPEMGFRMELIPLLARHGYRYVLVDSEYLTPLTMQAWPDLRYRPQLARHGGAEIVVIPRDRELSIAQESGCDPEWFLREVAARTRHCAREPLVTTATDGDNGGWFRNLTPGETFWDRLYRPLLDRIRAGTAGGYRPAFIHEYLDRHGPGGEVLVRAGAWNTGDHSGAGFVQWTGSPAQRDAFARVAAISARLARAAASVAERPGDTERERLLEEARWRLLRAESSCNFFWGCDWLPRCHRDLDDAAAWLDRLRMA